MLQSLFESKQYKEASSAVCGPDHPLIERVQVKRMLTYQRLRESNVVISASGEPDLDAARTRPSHALRFAMVYK